MGSKKRKIDFAQWKNCPYNQQKMSELEREMAQLTGNIFSTEDYLQFIEQKFDVSLNFRLTELEFVTFLKNISRKFKPWKQNFFRVIF